MTAPSFASTTVLAAPFTTTCSEKRANVPSGSVPAVWKKPPL
jgi:hypothetical protein